MLKLLLDEHVSPDVADGLRRRHRSLVIHWMAEWEGGASLGKDDSACVPEAAEQGLTLVTYDRRTAIAQDLGGRRAATRLDNLCR